MSQNICSKTQIANTLSRKTGLNKTKAFDTIGALFDIITDDLANGNDVRLVGFGSFRVRHRKARKGRNPQTGKPLTIAAREAASFRAGKGLKQAINHEK